MHDNIDFDDACLRRRQPQDLVLDLVHNLFLDLGWHEQISLGLLKGVPGCGGVFVFVVSGPDHMTGSVCVCLRRSAFVSVCLGWLLWLCLCRCYKENGATFSIALIEPHASLKRLLSWRQARHNSSDAFGDTT